jgi:N-acetyl sugar amidotransferase
MEQETEQLETYFGLPAHVEFCSQCVMSNQRPLAKRSEFNHNSESKTRTIRFENGICSACQYNEKKRDNIDWTQREKELREVCEKYRKDDGSYDCIVSGSGGKDSTMVSHILKYKYNMHPLTVTWAPHMYTEIGWRNFQSWIDSGFDNILVHPNGKVHKLLTKLAFQNLLHPFQPFIFGQKNLAPKMAVQFDIPLIFYGEPGIEYGDPAKDNSGRTRDPMYHTGSDHMNLQLGGIPVKDLIEKHGLHYNDLKAFLPVDPDIYAQKKIQVHYLGYYIRWDPQEAYYYAAENTGFQANTERTEGSYSKYSSIDDKADPFHYFTTLIKFGIGRATYDAAQEVRNKKITREEAVALVKKFDNEFPKKYFTEFLDYINMTEEQFWKTVDKFRSPHLWKKEDEQWKMRHVVYDNVPQTPSV